MIEHSTPAPGTHCGATPDLIDEIAAQVQTQMAQAAATVRKQAAHMINITAPIDAADTTPDTPTPAPPAATSTRPRR